MNQKVGEYRQNEFHLSPGTVFGRSETKSFDLASLSRPLFTPCSSFLLYAEEMPTPAVMLVLGWIMAPHATALAIRFSDMNKQMMKDCFRILTGGDGLPSVTELMNNHLKIVDVRFPQTQLQGMNRLYVYH